MHQKLRVSLLLSEDRCSQQPTLEKASPSFDPMTNAVPRRCLCTKFEAFAGSHKHNARQLHTRKFVAVTERPVWSTLWPDHNPLTAENGCRWSLFESLFCIIEELHDLHCYPDVLLLSLAPQPSLGLGLLLRIQLNFLEASQQFSFVQGRVISPTPNPHPGGPGLCIYIPQRQGGYPF
jgi:hypothetical protein